MNTVPGFGAAPAPQPTGNKQPQKAEVPQEEPETLDEEAASNVTPEEQAAYDEFVGQALNMISKPENQKVRDSLLKLLSAGEDRVAALASAAVNVVQKVEQSGARAGREFTADILLHGGQEIVEHLAEFAEAKKVHEFTAEEIEAAFLQAVDQYRMNNKDKIDPAAAQQELREIDMAGKEGNLDQIAPGLGEVAQKGQQLQQEEGGEDE